MLFEERYTSIDLLECREIALQLKLNQKSIFEADFWDKFQKYTLPP